MPGIFGIAGTHTSVQLQSALSMANACVHTDTHRVQAQCSVSNSHLTQVDYVWNPADTICKVGSATCCLWGEFYAVEGGQIENLAASKDARYSPAEILASATSENNLTEVLRKIEGAFAAAIVDSSTDRIWLACDKIGLVHLYLYSDESNGLVAWGTEAKSFCRIPGASLSIDSDALDGFRRHGHYSGLKTLHREVRLVEPASLIEICLKTGKIQSRTTYWNPSYQHPSGTFAGNRKDAVVEMGRLFRQSVECRIGSDQKIGILLSGGLDSRALIAAIHGKEMSIPTLTFGSHDCEDLRIAEQVNRVAKRQHHFVEIGKENWLQDRAKGVWATDGQLSILHMHAIACAKKVREQDWFQSHVSGHLGDAVLGGSYLKPNGTPSLIEVMNNRGRRFITEGLRLTAQYYDYRRCPFVDTRLLELVVSLPEKWLKDSALYNEMLMNEFPEYYGNIPWQSTGSLITASPLKVRARKLKKTIHKKLHNKLSGFIPAPKNRSYVDYPAWLREDPGKSFFEGILFDEQASYPEYISFKEATSAWKTFQQGRPLAVDLFGAIVTLEIYLRALKEPAIARQEPVG